MNKLTKSFFGIALGATFCFTAALSIASHREENKIEKVEANGTTATIYVSINASTIQSYTMKFSARRGGDDGGYTGDITMTEVENGITFTGKKVFRGTFTELYNGAEIWFKYFDGSTEKGYVHVPSKDWTALSDFNNKVFSFEGGQGSSWSSYSIPTRYSLIGSESSWATDRDLTGSGTAYSITRDMTRGETFKFRQNHSWYNEVGYNSTKVSGTGADQFTTESGSAGGNFMCLLNGTYTFTLNPSTSAVTIVDNTTPITTYTYVLTAWSDYSCAHLYDSNGNNGWSTAPAVSALDGGQGYNVKVVYGGNDYYGLYRINDRYIDSYDHLILKKSGDVSGKYANQSDTFELSGGSKIYLSTNNGSPTSEANTSNIYKAAEFIYDLVTKRGSATYDNHTFDYSICAISKSDATSLVNRYDTMASGPKAIVDVSTCFVYNLDVEYGEEVENKIDRYIPDLVDSLRIIANRPTGIGSQLLNLGTEEGRTAATVVVIVATMSILTASAYFFFKTSKKVGQ